MDQKIINDWDKYSKEHCSDPKLVHVWALWLKLSRARFTIKDGESILARLKIKPWDSQDPLISEAWKNLTAPENLEELEYWSKQSAHNPTAREETDRAIEDCKKRKAEIKP